MGVLVVGAIAVYLLNRGDTPTQTGLQNNDPGNTISRPAVQAIPNTFSIMTPEEKAAADEQARLQAEAAVQASSTASSTDEDDEAMSDAELEAEMAN